MSFLTGTSFQTLPRLKKYNEKEYLWVIEHVQPYGLTLIMTYDDNGKKI